MIDKIIIFILIAGVSAVLLLLGAAICYVWIWRNKK